MTEKYADHSREFDQPRQSVTASPPSWMKPEAHSAIELLMTAYESRSSLADLVFRQDRFKDALGHQNQRNIEDVHEYDEAVAEVIRFLTHIPANPSKSQLTELLIRSYCFARTTDCVNQSEQMAAAFLAKLVLRAKKTLLSPSGCKAESKIFALTGERGAGKTFFLNYLTSRFHSQLNQSKCIFVRINLTKYLRLDEDINHWFYAQATRILMKYYDPESVSFNARNPSIPIRRMLSSELIGELNSERLLSELSEFSTKFMGPQVQEICPAMGMDLCMRIVAKAQHSDIAS